MFCVQVTARAHIVQSKLIFLDNLNVELKHFPSRIRLLKEYIKISEEIVSKKCKNETCKTSFTCTIVITPELALCHSSRERLIFKTLLSFIL